MVVRANHPGSELGGHLSSYASVQNYSKWDLTIFSMVTTWSPVPKGQRISCFFNPIPPQASTPERFSKEDSRKTILLVSVAKLEVTDCLLIHIPGSCLNSGSSRRDRWAWAR